MTRPGRRRRYHQRFGIVHVAGLGAKGGTLVRTPKSSAQWLQQHFFSAAPIDVLKRKSVVTPGH
jgi:hypothetical protein